MLHEPAGGLGGHTLQLRHDARVPAPPPRMPGHPAERANRPLRRRIGRDGAPPGPLVVRGA
jgi:hypothetical protein